MNYAEANDTVSQINADLESIVAWVWRRFAFQEDSKTHRSIEHWPSNDELVAWLVQNLLCGTQLRGDCDDFALLVQLLVRYQYGADAGELLKCRVGQEGHLVYHFAGFVACVRHRTPVLKTRLNYTWVSRWTRHGWQGLE